MKIAIGCDHIVVDYKKEIIKYLEKNNIEVIDCGTNSLVRTHYPLYGLKVSLLVSNKVVDFGIVICGTGVGISNSCQKIKDTRVILSNDVLTTKHARETIDANILALGGRVTGIGLALDIIDSFINTSFNASNENKILVSRLNALVETAIENESVLDDVV